MAVKARPLTALTRKVEASGKPVAFEWSSECEQAFIELKQFLSSAPLLHPPDLSKEFSL